MFYLISKLFTFLLMPIGLLLVLVFNMIISKNRTKTKWIGFFTLLLTFLFSSPFLINQWAKCWEMPEKNIENLKNYDVGILLTGGIINSSSKYPTNLHLISSSDRLWQTLQLYKTGKIKRILISGGDTSILNKNILTEIDFALQFLIKNGVPKERIILEKKARNTFENAKFTAIILARNYPNGEGSFLLISSGFHLKRALACFAKQGIKTDYFSTNPLVSNLPFNIIDIIPSSAALNESELLSKELIGYWVYKMMGYA
jgi:uncharacterized SAM-binding protein YcdF (DUF218 family)